MTKICKNSNGVARKYITICCNHASAEHSKPLSLSTWKSQVTSKWIGVGACACFSSSHNHYIQVTRKWGVAARACVRMCVRFNIRDHCAHDSAAHANRRALAQASSILPRTQSFQIEPQARRRSLANVMPHHMRVSRPKSKMISVLLSINTWILKLGTPKPYLHSNCITNNI